MKINLAKHELAERDKIQVKDIPLAYIDADHVKRETNIAVDSNFINSCSKVIRPYDEFEDNDLYLFDSNKNLLRNVSMKRVGLKYYYEPKNMTEFAPVSFTCYAEIKRRMRFSNTVNYNLVVGVRETNPQNIMEFSDKLITIFSDAYKRGLCPANIKVNNGAMDSFSLINHEEHNCDFVFMKSKDGYHVGNSNQPIDIDDYLNNHVNLWLSCKDFQGMFQTVYTAQIPEITMDDPILYRDKSYSIKYTKKYMIFDTTKRNPDYSREVYDYIYINDRILVLRKQKKGYIIVTNEDFLNDAQQNAKLIYETLMKVYLNGYYKSREEKTWITDEAVDYMAYNNAKLGIRQGSVNLDRLLANDRFDAGSDYQLLSVKTSVEDVIFVGLDEKNNLLFEKIAGNKDPKKGPNEISYMTTKGTVINFVTDDINYIEEPISIETTINGPDIYVTIHAYHNSRYKINMESDQTLKMPDNYNTYLICVKRSKEGLDNEFNLVRPDYYRQDENGIKVASVSVISSSDVNVSDIRPLGGGLPEDLDGDYDLMDIGHVQGRPYRKGNALIIHLPKKLKTYKERIEMEVKKHVAAGDYPIFVFDL